MSDPKPKPADNDDESENAPPVQEQDDDYIPVNDPAIEGDQV